MPWVHYGLPHPLHHFSSTPSPPSPLPPPAGEWSSLTGQQRREKEAFLAGEQRTSRGFMTQVSEWGDGLTASIFISCFFLLASLVHPANRVLRKIMKLLFCSPLQYRRTDFNLTTGKALFFGSSQNLNAIMCVAHA